MLQTKRQRSVPRSALADPADAIKKAQAQIQRINNALALKLKGTCGLTGALQIRLTCYLRPTRSRQRGYQIKGVNASKQF